VKVAGIQVIFKGRDVAGILFHNLNVGLDKR
jgi:hypothetical protein